MSDLANRLVSVRLDPRAHPIRSDTRSALAVSGFRAARSRFDVAWTMRFLFMLWFAAVAVLPKRSTAWLADPFLFPERRPRLNRVLAGAHRDP